MTRAIIFIIGTGMSVLTLLILMTIVLKVVDFFRLIYYTFFTTLSLQRALEMFDSEWR